MFVCLLYICIVSYVYSVDEFKTSYENFFARSYNDYYDDDDDDYYYCYCYYLIIISNYLTILIVF